MEGVATPDGGKTLVGVMQSPLDNPKAAGRASRLVRIVVVNTETGASKQYAYLLDTPSLANSDIVALGGSRYVVVERDGNFIQSGSAAKRLYQIDLAGATDISDPGNGAAGLLVGGKTLEELTANQADPAGVLRAAGYEPVAKQLAVDLLVAYPGYAHDKGEGLTLVAPGRIAVSNDDDFGVTTGTGGLVQKLIPGTTQTDFTEVVFVDLP
jgi:hypothetical protein